MSRDHRASDQLTADTIHVPCPTCGAEANVPCERGGVTARTPCHRRILAACPRAAEHHTQENRPDLYRLWRERPEVMARTYRRAQCESCGSWSIWVPKEQS